MYCLHRGEKKMGEIVLFLSESVFMPIWKYILFHGLNEFLFDLFIHYIDAVVWCFRFIFIYFVVSFPHPVAIVLDNMCGARRRA